MTTVGMDAIAMRQLAADFQRTAADINGVVDRVHVGVRGVSAEWFGEAGHRFTTTWNASVRAGLLALDAHLLLLADHLNAEIDAQERASRPSSVSALACSAPAWSLGNGRSATYGPNGELRITQQRVLDGKGPRSVSDLLDPLKGKDGSVGGVYGYPGGISVSVTGIEPNRYAVVTIAGTENWFVGTSNPNDVTTDVEHLVGSHTEKAYAISEALRRSGITSTDHVMLVGHSLGGADAIEFSALNARDDHYRIDGIVTVGAPPTPNDPPAAVDVLALTGNRDDVPHLGIDPGGPGPSVHTVVVPEPAWILPYSAHHPDVYQQHLPNDSPTVRDFERRHAGFFTGGPASTTMFSNERVHASSPFRLDSLVAPTAFRALP